MVTANEKPERYIDEKVRRQANGFPECYIGDAWLNDDGERKTRTQVHGRWMKFLDNQLIVWMW